MSVSAVTERPISTHRLVIVGAVLAGLALIAALVAIAVSDNNSTPGRGQSPVAVPSQAAAPATQATFRDPVTHALLPIPTQGSAVAPATVATQGTFRDPVTHALLRVNTQGSVADPATVATRGTFRDPVTHALLPIATPGPGK